MNKNSSNKLKDFLEKHIIPVFICALFLVGGSIYKIIDKLYENQYNFKYDELEQERDRIEFNFNNDFGYINPQKIFISDDQIPANLMSENTGPFAIQKTNFDSEKYIYKVRSEEELIKEMNEEKIGDLGYLENLIQSKDIYCYESVDYKRLIIDSIEIKLKKRALFTFISWEKFALLQYKLSNAVITGFLDHVDDAIENLCSGLRNDIKIWSHELYFSDSTTHKYILEDLENDSNYLELINELVILQDNDLKRFENYLNNIDSIFKNSYKSRIINDITELKEEISLDKYNKSIQESLDKIQDSIKNHLDSINLMNEYIYSLNKLEIFINLFSKYSKTTLSPIFGIFKENTYSFDKNAYLIKGYYDLSQYNQEIKRLYIIEIGVRNDNGIYMIKLIVPKENISDDFGAFLSMLQGVKIIDN